MVSARRIRQFVLLLVVLALLAAPTGGTTADSVDTVRVLDDPHPMTLAPAILDVTETPTATSVDDSAAAGCSRG